MVDVVDAATRSRMMSGIRGRNTKPERLLRSALHRLGFRFRLHAKDLPGRPDIILPRYRAVILVHGCFWHRHDGCRHATTPASNADFWQGKLEGNVKRDRLNLGRLIEAGWRVATVWECMVRQQGADAVAETVASWLVTDDKLLELP